MNRELKILFKKIRKLCVFSVNSVFKISLTQSSRRFSQSFTEKKSILLKIFSNT